MNVAFALPAVAGLEQTPALVRDVDAAIAAAAGGTVLLDAAALTEFDTSAVALLLHAQRAARARDLKLEVRGAPPKLLELARLYGVHELLALESA